MWQSIGIVSIGAVLGAVTRWLLYVFFNPLFHSFAFGPLVANLTSCFFIGVFTAFCWYIPSISEQWKLFMITGFFGSLSTISAISAEFWTNFLNGKAGLGLLVLSGHLIGSLSATFLGIYLVSLYYK
ncbi:CrcB family protein [Pasteurellaceae bacterium 22721_9_1]